MFVYGRHVFYVHIYLIYCHQSPISSVQCFSSYGILVDFVSSWSPCFADSARFFISKLFVKLLRCIINESFFIIVLSFICFNFCLITQCLFDCGSLAYSMRKMMADKALVCTVVYSMVILQRILL